jgi:hypothetical protein
MSYKFCRIAGPGAVLAILAWVFAGGTRAQPLLPARAPALPIVLMSGEVALSPATDTLPFSHLSKRSP